MSPLWNESVPTSLGYREADPETVARYRDQVRIVDVREPEEWDGELGHIPGAELVPLPTVRAHFQRHDENQLIVLVCRSGGRSGRAAEQLSGMGFTHLINMAGGMIQWNAARLPVERDEPLAAARGF